MSTLRAKPSQPIAGNFIILGREKDRKHSASQEESREKKWLSFSSPVLFLSLFFYLPQLNVHRL